MNSVFKFLFVYFTLYSLAFGIDKDRVIKEAKYYVSQALSNHYIQDAHLTVTYEKILTLLNDKPIISVKKCSGRFANYVAYVLPDAKQGVQIHICKGYENLPYFSLAQTIIHELSHHAGVLDEYLATRVESLALFLSGRTPELNGCNSSDVIFDVIEDLSEKDLKERKLDYFVLQDIRTKKALKEHLLRTYIIYDRKVDFDIVMKQICKGDEACQQKILQSPDKFGKSMNDLKREVGRTW